MSRMIGAQNKLLSSVIPAKAGIQAARAARRAVATQSEGLDSRLCGNDDKTCRIVTA